MSAAVWRVALLKRIAEAFDETAALKTALGLHNEARLNRDKAGAVRWALENIGGLATEGVAAAAAPLVLRGRERIRRRGKFAKAIPRVR